MYEEEFKWALGAVFLLWRNKSWALRAVDSCIKWNSNMGFEEVVRCMKRD